MKLFNKAGEKFSDFFGVSDDLYDDDIFEDEEVQVQEEVKEQPILNTQIEKKTIKNEVQESTYRNNTETKRDSLSSETIRESNVELGDQNTNEKIVEMNIYQPPSNNNSRMMVTRQQKQRRQVTVYEPLDYLDCKRISQALFRKEIIIISFELMDEKTARRVVDFMTGVVYALDGDIQRLGDELFICTPANVDVDSNMTRSLISTYLRDY